MTGKIQLGVAPGCIPQVIVPALTFAPAGATGIDPIPPGTVTLLAVLLPPPLLEPLLLQAASAVMLATARARPATVSLLRNLITGPPCVRWSRLRSILGS